MMFPDGVNCAICISSAWIVDFLQIILTCFTSIAPSFRIFHYTAWISGTYICIYHAINTAKHRDIITTNVWQKITLFYWDEALVWLFWSSLNNHQQKWHTVIKQPASTSLRRLWVALHDKAGRSHLPVMPRTRYSQVEKWHWGQNTINEADFHSSWSGMMVDPIP